MAIPVRVKKLMKVLFKGRTVKEDSYMEIACDMTKDDYSVSQRDISVVVCVNGEYIYSLKEYFEVEVVE